MIQVKALAAIIRPENVALLVTQGEDGTKDGYARLLGGSVEFGELAQDAVYREIKEELGSDLTFVSLIGVLENRFALNGVAGHEIVFVFCGELTEQSFYNRKSIPILDVPGLHAEWWSPETHNSRLVPEGLNELLKTHLGTHRP
jgi:ADP-ribose pyrophosphatase YjhB (NUDIX family)